MLHPYAELHCVTNFSFLRGASSPEELVGRAHELGYAALAITDECSLAGVVRGHQQAKQTGLPLIIGAEFALRDAWSEPCHRQARLVLLACNRNGYGNLSELITTARMRAGKGSYRLLRDDLAGGIADCVALLVPDPAVTPEHLAAQARFFAERFGGHAWLAAELLAHGDDQALLDKLRGATRASGLPLVAAGDVHFHLRSRKSLQDTLTAIRLKRPVHELGFALAPNAEQHLRARVRLGQVYPHALLEETLEVASRCGFSLDELRYEYPEEIVEAGHTPKKAMAAASNQRMKAEG